MQRFSFLLPLALLLSGCYSLMSGAPKEVHEKHCLDQGHVKETPEFLHCVETRVAEERRVHEERRHTERRRRNAKRQVPQQGQRVLEW